MYFTDNYCIRAYLAFGNLVGFFELIEEVPQIKRILNLQLMHKIPFYLDAYYLITLVCLYFHVSGYIGDMFVNFLYCKVFSYFPSLRCNMFDIFITASGNIFCRESNAFSNLESKLAIIIFVS